MDVGGRWCELLFLLGGRQGWGTPPGGFWQGVPDEARLKVSSGGLLESLFIREKGEPSGKARKLLGDGDGGGGGWGGGGPWQAPSPVVLDLFFILPVAV